MPSTKHSAPMSRELAIIDLPNLSAGTTATGALSSLALDSDAEGLRFDLANLCVLAPTTPPSAAAAAAAQRDALQALYARLFSLPTVRLSADALAILPSAYGHSHTPAEHAALESIGASASHSLPLPRAKPLPAKAKKLTKWQEFAAAKGITKRKKSRKVWDEQLQQYRPSWGYGRANAQDDEWAVPIKATPQGQTKMRSAKQREEEAYAADPWQADKAARKQRVDKQKKQQARNVGRGAGKPLTAASTPSLNTIAGGIRDSTPAVERGAGVSISRTPAMPNTSRAQRKQELASTLVASRAATASMGKHQRTLDNEPRPAKQRSRKGGLLGLDQSAGVTKKGSVQREQAASLKLLDRVITGKGKPPPSAAKSARAALDVGKAVNRHLNTKGAKGKLKASEGGGGRRKKTR